jgi:hypothetical protein
MNGIEAKRKKADSREPSFLTLFCPLLPALKCIDGTDKVWF